AGRRGTKKAADHLALEGGGRPASVGREGVTAAPHAPDSPRPAAGRHPTPDRLQRSDPPPPGEGEERPSLPTKLRTALPFALTASQEAAIADIGRDLARPERMLRLLQGDVGAGKTVVALFACAMAIAAG